MQISDGIKDLYKRLTAINRILNVPDEDINKIGVDAIIGKLAYLYEKMRVTMDYQEDHLLRRFAIERNIRRSVILETLKPEMARSIVEDLIRSGYLLNNKLPETIIAPVETVLKKYAYLIDLVHDELHEGAERRKIVTWLIAVMACEIDLILVPEFRIDALIEMLYTTVRDRIKFHGGSIPEREKNIQLYITLHKELVLSDNPIIAYHLLNLYFPDWPNADKRLVEFVAGKITSVYYGIEHHLLNPIRKKMSRSLKKQIVVFKILRELVTVHQNDLASLFGDPELLESETRKVITRNYKSTRAKLTRSSIRAVLYILITKVALALLIEYPYDMYAFGVVNYTALSINILFPPVLMFFVTLSARLPGPQNTKALVSELLQIVYGQPQQTILCELRVRKEHGPVYFFFEYVVYVLLYGLIFGGLIFLLSLLKFNILSGGIFLFFVTAVSFFGTRIRQVAKDFNVETQREGVLGYITTFFSLPLIRAGQWLSVNMRRINLIAFVMDFIIEAPFKLLVQLIENWFVFLREKKEDTYKSS
ncbi:MAG: hypothetical protein A2677_00470 [Candidatus Komeilibacteria bacterium RIFCSPHIGHO2_01_FULL_52_14]|uniref:Uncharacterized protein n=1 Tax=Candidatus Komeilibacteria bacterium RIFCSPHIGHO2_01_FULL_52_14 TaxID=1798549 RepID=A0A1G2BJU1_9BACT|nr:MAG: hypothetical protein A2677_00470 [Candidatus Komeilibacteria bacterium RIFCSPHIGHO2_01_FULL_52_14]